MDDVWGHAITARLEDNKFLNASLVHVGAVHVYRYKLIITKFCNLRKN